MSPSDAKDNLREEVLNRRKSLSEEQVKNKSSEIIRRLKELDIYKNAETVFTYISFDNEVKTTDILESGKRIIVPYVEDRIKLSEYGKLVKGKFGIPEPKEKVPAKTDDIGLVIVPGIAFDLIGNRIGFGVGYYDELLTSINAPRVALCFEFQLRESIPKQPHDIRMDYIITEKRVIKCG